MKEMSTLLKRKVPLTIVSVLALFLVADYFLNIPMLNSLGRTLKDWGTLTAAFALFLGIANISRTHILHVTRRSPKWWLSLWTVLVMFAFFILGVIDLRAPIYVQWYTVIKSGIGTTTNSLLAFYISSAAYRALKIKSGESAILVIAAVLAMMFNAPVGGTIHPILPVLGKWVLDVPDAAAFRGVILGIATGVIALGVRMILQIEKGYLGIADEG